MTDFHLVDPQGWEYDLQSVYSAYMGYFQLHGIQWHDRIWGHFFETFEQFLAFSWPVVTVTDARTGRAHIVTRMTSINAFLRMIKTRFGETLPQVDNLLIVSPVEISQRHLRHVSDWSTYKKLHSALPAVSLAALKARVRSGEPRAIRELWAARDKTFLAIDFECLEKNDRSCVEWGYAAIRSSHLEAAGAWPPVPDTNYRKGHYIVSEYADKASPTRKFAFGVSQVLPKAKLPRMIQSILSGLLSPDSETVANSVVLVGHGIQAILQHLEEMEIKLPTNVLVLDVAYLERALFTTGERGAMVDRKSGRARLPETLLSLGGLLHTFGIDPPCVLHNAGNDAFLALVLFQRMVDPMGGVAPPKGAGKGENGGSGHGHGHVRRAATVAARLFRPLGNSDVGKNGTGTGTGKGTGNANGVDEMGVNLKRASVFSTLTSPGSTVSPDEKKKKVNGTGNVVAIANVNANGAQMRDGRRNGVDEMANLNAFNVKRASMFSTLASPGLTVPPDEKKGGSNASTTGSGRWLRSSTLLPSQRRRHSAMHLRSFGEVLEGE